MKSILTRKQQSPFRFLDLPPELRNHIYADILTTKYKTYRPIPRCYRPADGLAILRVSKLVYQEARPILYQAGIFRFWFPFGDPPFSLYNDLSTKPLTDLMQNVTFDIERPDCSYPEVLRSANSFLHRFSNHMIPRLRCTIFIWLDCDDILSDIWFLDLFGKLTAFKTVVLKHFGLKLGSRMNSVQGSTSKTVDEYLSMILGPGEYISEVHDSRFGPSHCLTYHPRQHVYSMKGPEITG